MGNEDFYKLVKELSGKEYNEDLLDVIFSKFCLGKVGEENLTNWITISNS